MPLKIAYSFFLALSSWVFVNILEDEDMIFGWYARLIERLPKWLSKPLGSCDICLAGQLGFWGYFLLKDYKLLEHLFFTVLTIFFVKIIDRIIYGLRM